MDRMKHATTFFKPWILLTAAGLVAEAGGGFGNRSVFLESLKKASDLRLLEGLPHQALASQLFESEFRTKKVVTLHEFSFYAELLQLTATDSRQLVTLLRSRKSLRKFTGPKACGGFHPDFALEWSIDGKTFSALICLGCHEIKFFGPNSELYCDIADHAYKPLLGILSQYQRNRPGRLLH